MRTILRKTSGKKIYLPGGNNCETLAALLKYGFRGGKFARTYSNKDCTIDECHVARRSFSDLLLIARTYFPKTTEKELSQLLHSMPMESLLCGQINKVVFKMMGEGYFYFNDADDSRFSRQEGVDGWSYSKIKQLFDE